MNNYTIYHLHSDMSNAFTTMDSVTKYKSYIEKAKEYGMSALAFSEHGNILSWISKKLYCEENGIKYIHAIETYVTKSKEEKVRDNMHCVLLAKNIDGVKELNKMHSFDSSFNRSDGHFYHSPRITYEELKSTSDNIIITTACLGGILNCGDPEIELDFVEFMEKNKHRCFLEIQHHNILEQIEYNKKMYSISKKTGIPLIAGTDTHALTEEHMLGRKLLQKRKGIHFEVEDEWDLSMKSYDELVEAYTRQKSLPLDIILEAIENTNVMASMIDAFGLDYSHKYPKLYDDSEEVFKQKINSGFISRNIDKKGNRQEYIDRIKYELDVFKYNGAIDFMLLEEKIKSAMASEGIYAGYSRGSVSGSLIAYVLGITEIDSIKFNMNFERFMNKERVSLADIDSDWSLNDRPRVKEYIYSIENTYNAEIITFNTIAIKGAIRDCGGGLDMELSIVDEIAKNIEFKEDEYRKKYPELFKYVDMLQGTIVSIGIHPAATVVSPFPLDELLGTFSSTTCEYPITQVNMKEIDLLNFLKLDVLGLDNIGIINDTCKKAGIDRIVPDNMDFDDDLVWENIIKSPVNIFQFEGNFAHNYLSELLSKYKDIKQKSPNVTRVALMSLANGAIRPAGDSYRAQMLEGIIKDNGNNALNDMMSATMGYLVYQEQIINFLNKFCGYSMGEADIIRRGFAKKTGTEKYIPNIKSGFIKTMIDEYGYSDKRAEEDIEQFLQIIEDASRYLFSLNHSDPYTFIGFATGYLRTYYPMEFLSTVLDYNEDDLEKTGKVIEYANKIAKINIKPIKFRHSSGSYQPNNDEGAIYKGIGSIKGLNSLIGDQLYSIKDYQFDSFVDFLFFIKRPTSALENALLDKMIERDFGRISINQSQLLTLIRLDFFSEFGKPKKLETIMEMYYKWFNKKTAKFYNKKKDEHIELPFSNEILEKYSEKKTDCQFSGVDYVGIIRECEKLLDDEDFSIKEKIQFQLEYLGYVNFTDKYVDKRYVLVTNLNTKYSPRFSGYCLNNGITEELKVRRKPKRRQSSNTYFEDVPFVNGDILYVSDFERKMGVKKVDDDWVETGIFDFWCKNYRIAKEI